MALQTIWDRFKAELDLLSIHSQDFAAAKPTINASSQFLVADEFFLEGLLSRLWQAWCEFCRSCVIESCLGTVTNAGVVVAPLLSATSEPHVSGAAVRARHANINPPYWGTMNTILRLEPTWGDVDVLDRIIRRLLPTNSGQLRAAFSSAHPSAKALQAIRNGAAHNNIQTFAEIQALRSAYIVFSITHPTQAMFWIEPTSSVFLIAHAIEELADAGLAAIS